MVGAKRASIEFFGETNALVARIFAFGKTQNNPSLQCNKILPKTCSIHYFRSDNEVSSGDVDFVNPFTNQSNKHYSEGKNKFRC